MSTWDRHVRLVGLMALIAAAAAFAALPAAAVVSTQPPPQQRSVPPMRSTPGSQSTTLPAAVREALASVQATNTGYDLDFTLPTAAKAGCSVCHADPDLVRLGPDGTVNSYHVNPAVIGSSAHSAIVCAGCHTGFASTAPHEGTADWRVEAKSVCGNCHQQSMIDYGRSAHGQQATSSPVASRTVSASGTAASGPASAAATASSASAPGTLPSAPTTKAAAGPQGSAAATTALRPLCGDCHGGHAIPVLTDNPQGVQIMRDDGWNVCGKCHEEYWNNYDDAYHGAAYKSGEPDAPSCWDCHGFHEILPSDNPDSNVSVRHLPETCSQCHSGDDERYLEYAVLIHGSAQEKADNPLYSFVYALGERLLPGVFDL